MCDRSNSQQHEGSPRHQMCHRPPADRQIRNSTGFNGAACTTCQKLPNYGGYSVCRHIGRVVDFDLANEDGFMVSASLPVCVPVRLPVYVSGC